MYMCMYVPFVVVGIRRMQVSMLYFFSYICSGKVPDVGNIYPRFWFVRWTGEWMDEIEWIECNVMNDVWIQYTLLYVFACNLIGQLQGVLYRRPVCSLFPVSVGDVYRYSWRPLSSAVINTWENI